LKSFCQ